MKICGDGHADIIMEDTPCLLCSAYSEIEEGTKTVLSLRKQLEKLTEENSDLVRDIDAFKNHLGCK